MSQSLTNARAHMLSALQLLDSSNVSADIGAHLDLAVWRLDQELRIGPPDFRPDAGDDQRQLNSRLQQRRDVHQP